MMEMIPFYLIFPNVVGFCYIKKNVNTTLCKMMSINRIAEIKEVLICTYEPRHDKTNKMSVRPAKPQISLGIRPV